MPETMSGKKEAPWRVKKSTTSAAGATSPCPFSPSGSTTQGQRLAQYDGYRAAPGQRHFPSRAVAVTVVGEPAPDDLAERTARPASLSGTL